MGIKRPLIFLLGAYLAGLALHYASVLFMIENAALAFLGILVWLLIRNRKYRLHNYFFLLLLPPLMIGGYFLINRQLAVSEADTAFFQKENGTLEGKISLVEETEEYTRLTITKGILTIAGEESFYKLKLLVYADTEEKYLIGNQIKATGSVLKFLQSTNPGQFNEFLYYKTKNYDYKFYADSVLITSSKTNSYYQSLRTIKNKLILTYYKLLSDKNAGILTAMMLGDTSYLKDDIKELYRENGITHILAISGLHISLLGLTLYKIFRRLHLPLALATVLTLYFLYSYGILTGFGVSTNRAVVMMSVYLAAVLTGRTYDLLSGTALSALIILLQSPLEITNAGFLLSFGAVLGIGTIYPVLNKVLVETKEKNKKKKHEITQLEKFKYKKPKQVTVINNLREKSVFDVVQEMIVNILKQTFFSGLSVQLMLMPILLWFFYEVPVYSLLVNLLIIPLSSFLTILAFLSVLIGCINVPLGSFLMGSVNYILEFYEAVCRIGSGLPGNSILTGRPEILIILLYYVFLYLFVQINKKKFSKPSLILLCTFLLLFIPIRSNNLEVTFLDVGQGDGIFLRLPSGTAMLVDSGSSDVKKLGRYRIEPFLKYNGIKEIEYAVITHGDSDHYSGILELIGDDYQGDIRIKNLILPGVSFDDKAYLTLIQAAKRKGIKVSTLNTGDSFKDGEVSLNCLWPVKGISQGSDMNSHSIVLSLKYREFDLLLTGDLEGVGEGYITNIIAKTGSYDILKVAHHGSKYSTGSDFLEAVSPDYAIISCGIDNSYGHPHEETLERLITKGSEILKTTDNGAIIVITDGNRLKIREWVKGTQKR